MFFGSTSSRSFSSSCMRRQRLRRAMATARLASPWPMMKRSSSETISRGEKSVMRCAPLKAPGQRQVGGRHRLKLIARGHDGSAALQRLDRYIAVGVDADVGGDVER